MRTYLIVHTKERRFACGSINTYDLGTLSGKQARDVAVARARVAGIKADDLSYTPKVVGGVRFYIGVVR